MQVDTKSNNTKTIVKTYKDLPDNLVILKKVLEMAKEDGLENYIHYDKFIGYQRPLAKWIYRVEGGNDSYINYEELKKSIKENIDALSMLEMIKVYVEKSENISMYRLRKLSDGLIVYRKPYCRTKDEAQKAIKWISNNIPELLEDVINEATD